MASKIIVTAQLGEEFSDSIEEAIHEKLRVAQNKWDVSLTREQQDLVIDNSRYQLKKKLLEVYKHEQKVERYTDQGFADDEEEDDFLDEYDNSLDLSTIYITVKTRYHDRDISITVGEDTPKTASLLITRTSQGYIAADEETESTVWLSEFPQRIKSDILKWAKTAVFYGVGSFKQ